MKLLKIIVACAISTIALSVSGAITSKATIKIQANQSTRAKSIFLYEDASVTDSEKCIPFTEDNYTFYAFAQKQGSTDSCNMIRQANLDGVTISFKASKAEKNYTITFSNVLGTIKLQKGSDTQNLIDVVNGSIPLDVDNFEEDIIFTVIMPNVYTRDVISNNWGTLCLPKASTAITGANIFTVAGKKSDETGIYLLEYNDDLVAGTPYVFQATSNKLEVTYDANPAVEKADTVNGLIGSFNEVSIAQGLYIIVDNKLKQTADATCKVRANGAYFDFEKMSEYTPQGGAPVRFMPTQKGSATELEAIEDAKADGKMFINGQLIIIKNGIRYNAQGAKL